MLGLGFATFINEFTGLIWTGNPKTLSCWFIHLHTVLHQLTPTCLQAKMQSDILTNTLTHKRIITESSCKKKKTTRSYLDALVKTWNKKSEKWLIKCYLSIDCKNPETAIQDSQKSAPSHTLSIIPAKSAEADRIFLAISPKCPSPDGPQRHTWHSV